VVRTPAFHVGYRGSSPLGITIKKQRLMQALFFFALNLILQLLMKRKFAYFVVVNTGCCPVESRGEHKVRPYLGRKKKPVVELEVIYAAARHPASTLLGECHTPFCQDVFCLVLPLFFCDYLATHAWAAENLRWH
jgi:hypothetical protein